MSDPLQKVDEWRRAGAGLAAALREELKQIDARRERIITELTHLEGKPPKEAGTGNGGRGRYSAVTLAIFDVLREAGPEGLTAAEVQETVSEDLGYQVRREIIATQLSRSKRVGKLQATGLRGTLRYAYLDEDHDG
jgi:hypothetical protein